MLARPVRVCVFQVKIFELFLYFVYCLCFPSLPPNGLHVYNRLVGTLHIWYFFFAYCLCISILLPHLLPTFIPDIYDG